MIFITIHYFSVSDNFFLKRPVTKPPFHLICVSVYHPILIISAVVSSSRNLERSNPRSANSKKRVSSGVDFIELPKMFCAVHRQRISVLSRGLVPFTFPSPFADFSRKLVLRVTYRIQTALPRSLSQ